MLDFCKFHRGVIDLFMLYEDQLGLRGLTSRVDMTCVMPRQMQFSLLGKVSKDLSHATPTNSYSPEKQFHELLTSQEFRGGLMSES